MKNEFVTYDQSLALKELGFNEDCFAVYSEHDETRVYNQSDIREGLTIPSPLYQQAFRWFREKHDIHCEFFVDDSKTFGFLISQFVDDGRIDKPIQRKYLDYEEAEQACLDELIKILKNV